jgi:hypothetical protein
VTDFVNKVMICVDVENDQQNDQQNDQKNNQQNDQQNALNCTTFYFI